MYVGFRGRKSSDLETVHQEGRRESNLPVVDRTM